MFGLCVRGVMGMAGCVVATPAWVGVAVAGVTALTVISVGAELVKLVKEEKL